MGTDACPHPDQEPVQNVFRRTVRAPLRRGARLGDAAGSRLLAAPHEPPGGPRGAARRGGLRAPSPRRTGRSSRSAGPSAPSACPCPRSTRSTRPPDAWLEEDLGDLTLFDAVVAAEEEAGGTFPAALVPVYRRILEESCRASRSKAERAVDYSVAFPRPALDAQAMRWDLSYFKYHFLMLAHVRFHEDRLGEGLPAADRISCSRRTRVTSSIATSSRGTSWSGTASRRSSTTRAGGAGRLQYDVASTAARRQGRDSGGDVRELLGALPLGASAAASRWIDEPVPRALPRLRPPAHAAGARHVRLPGLLRATAPLPAEHRAAGGDVERLLADGFVRLDLPELRGALERVCTTEGLRPAEAALRARDSRSRGLASRTGAATRPTRANTAAASCSTAAPRSTQAGTRSTNAALGRDAEVVRFMEARPDTNAFFDAVCPRRGRPGARLPGARIHLARRPLRMHGRPAPFRVLRRAPGPAPGRAISRCRRSRSATPRKRAGAARTHEDRARR